MLSDLNLSSISLCFSILSSGMSRVISAKHLAKRVAIERSQGVAFCGACITDNRSNVSPR